jgi:hypothetical protein
LPALRGNKFNDQIVVLVVRNNYSLHHVVILPDVFYGAYWKWLVYNTKWPILKDPAVEINSILLF